MIDIKYYIIAIILSIFILVAGIILFIFSKNKNNKKMKNAGITLLIIGILLTLSFATSIYFEKIEQKKFIKTNYEKW